MMKDITRKVRDFLFSRRQSYRIVFGGVHGQKVLADLAKFCRANETTIVPDERLTNVLEGRREVWLRIQQQLKLSDEDLWRLYSRDPLE